MQRYSRASRGVVERKNISLGSSSLCDFPQLVRAPFPYHERAISALEGLRNVTKWPRKRFEIQPDIATTTARETKENRNGPTRGKCSALNLLALPSLHFIGLSAE